jgi:methionyl-tRNA formyltransferase
VAQFGRVSIDARHVRGAQISTDPTGEALNNDPRERSIHQHLFDWRELASRRVRKGLTGTRPPNSRDRVFKSFHSTVGFRWGNTDQRFRSNLTQFLTERPFDYLFSIVNPRILSPSVLALPTGLAINFHDARMPRDAGVHATAWAVLNRATCHGVTWHVMTAQADAGDILAQRVIPTDHTDTSYTLNLKCLQAGVESFTDLVDDLASGRLTRTAQDLRNRTYHARATRPRGALTISWHHSAEDIDAAVRATQFGPHPNEFGTVKLAAGAEWAVVGATTVTPQRSTAPAGSVLAVTNKGMTVATVSHDLSLAALMSMSGTPINPADLALRPGHRLSEPNTGHIEALTVAYRDAVPHERYWVQRLAELRPLTLSSSESTGTSPAGARSSARNCIRCV